MKNNKIFCNKSDPHSFHHSARSASEGHCEVLTPSAFPALKSNSEHCWNSLVRIDQTIQFDTESRYCLLIVKKQEGTAW